MKKSELRNRGYINDITKNSYIGEIVSVEDDQHDGACKIRVFGVFGDKSDNLGKIPDSDLPFAYPIHGLSGGSASGTGEFSTPKKGTKVRVIFDGNNVHHPRYWAIEEISKELKTILQNDYTNFHSILYDSDEDTGIYYAQKSGLVLFNKGSVINILPDKSILIRHDQDSGIIEMRGADIDIVTNNSVNISTPNNITINSNNVHVNGVLTDVGANPIFSNCNTEILMKLILILATAIDAKYPTTPGQFSGIVGQMQELILSQTVKVSP